MLQCISAVVWEGGYILGAATSRYNAEKMTTVSWLAVLNRARFLECLSQTETQGLCQSSRKDYFVNVVYSGFILQQYIRSLTASRYVPYKLSRFSCDKQSRSSMIPSILYAINSAPNASTRESPHTLMFGMKLTYPRHLLKNVFNVVSHGGLQWSFTHKGYYTPVGVEVAYGTPLRTVRRYILSASWTGLHYLSSSLNT